MYKSARYDRISLKTAPATEVITLAEIKAYLGIPDTSLDTALNSWITAVRMAVEMYLGLSLITQTWQTFYDLFPGTNRAWILPYTPISITLPKAPLVSVSSITWYNTSNTPTIVDPTTYQVAIYNGVAPQEGRIAFNTSFIPPSAVNLRNLDSTIIEFVAGYGAATAVPLGIKAAMMQEIGYRMNNKDGPSIQQEAIYRVYSVTYAENNNSDGSGLSKTVRAMLQPYRKLRL